MHHLGQDAFPYLQRDLETGHGGIDHYRALIGLMQEKFDPEQYLPPIWKLAGNKSKPLRELVAKVVSEKDTAAEMKAIELLNNKSADVRQTAALILTQFSSPAANEATSNALNKETSDNARDILLQSVAHMLPVKADEKFINEMVEAAKQRGKLNKPVEAWLDENSLPLLYDHAGRQISTERVRFLLYRMSRVKEMRSDIEAKYIIQTIDKEKAGDFGLELIKLYMDKNAKPEFKWLMALAALLGNEAAVDKILSINARYSSSSTVKCLNKPSKPKSGTTLSPNSCIVIPSSSAAVSNAARAAAPTLAFLLLYFRLYHSTQRNALSLPCNASAPTPCSAIL